HGEQIREAAAQQVAHNQLAIGSPYLCWAIGTFAADVVGRVFAAIPPSVGLTGALVGSGFDAAVARGYADDDPIHGIGLELAGLLLAQLSSSLQRISPRYVEARYQALLDAEEAAKSPIAAEASPQPAAAKVITSHPMDAHVVAAFVGGAVRWNDSEQYRKDHPDQAKTHGL